MDLEGKRALVTGAGIGIGREIALELAREGADVVLSYHTSSAGAASAATEISEMGRRAQALPADLGDVQACFGLVDAAVEFLGGLDIVVNNAGRTMTGPFTEVTPEQFDRLFATNMRAQFFVAQRAVPALAESHGNIVNVASVHSLASAPGHSVYEATKGAIAAWTRSLAIDLAKYQIRANAVAPGAIEVPRFFDSPSYTSERMGAAIPFGRVGQPIDVAQMCAFLASERASYITGALFLVDGGLMARLPLFP